VDLPTDEAIREEGIVTHAYDDESPGLLDEWIRRAKRKLRAVAMHIVSILWEDEVNGYCHKRSKSPPGRDYRMHERPPMSVRGSNYFVALENLGTI
jgi:hypothetical protein